MTTDKLREQIKRLNLSFVRLESSQAIALLDELDRLRATVCNMCHGTGRICVGNSGLESDGNAPVLEDCPECAYLYDTNAARLEGWRRAQEQAYTTCDSVADKWQTKHFTDREDAADECAIAIRALQPPAEWGTE